MTDTDDDRDPIRAAMDRRLAELRAIDTRASLEGISPNRDIRRTHTHSRRHRAYNR